MQILVTGGAGYIGSTLVPRLLDRGDYVTVLDNFRYQQTSLFGCCAHPRFEVIRGDARDETTMRDALRRADVVIPLAAIVGAPACDTDPYAATSTNLDAITLLLRLRSRDQQIVSPCTNSGYGIGDKDTFCTEASPLRPISLYGRTKVEAEQAILAAGNGISLRLATVFGMSPRMRLDLLVNDFVYRAVTDGFIVVFEGHFMRNYIHVRDVTDAFVFALDHVAEMNGEAYNVGLSDANISKLDLCERIRRIVPKFNYFEAAIGQDADKRDYVVSNEKIERLGFKPTRSLDDGIAELVKGYEMMPAPAFTNIP
ncbi:MAG TPA: NAD(P)-dependent oxidoreductase [Vicinamibacterales bacterium]|nr:NAD(P)-dependent oxidoreductase [Vicinamibacterales bacterium]